MAANKEPIFVKVPRNGKVRSVNSNAIPASPSAAFLDNPSNSTVLMTGELNGTRVDEIKITPIGPTDADGLVVIYSKASPSASTKNIIAVTRLLAWDPTSNVTPTPASIKPTTGVINLAEDETLEFAVFLPGSSTVYSGVDVVAFGGDF